MVKVGQIYKDKTFNFIYAITWIAMDKVRYFMVRNDGFFLHSNDFDIDDELIAEYPSWQEAVNSKEFNNES